MSLTHDVGPEIQPSNDKALELIKSLREELKLARDQVKREEELRIIAEDNLHLCQIQLRKEQEAVQLLRKRVIGFETKMMQSKTDCL